MVVPRRRGFPRCRGTPGAVATYILGLVAVVAVSALSSEDTSGVPTFPIQTESVGGPSGLLGVLPPEPKSVDDPDMVQGRPGECRLEPKHVYTNNADWLACKEPGFFLSGFEHKGPYCTHESTMTIEKNSHRPGGDYKTFKLGRFGQERHCRAQCNRERRCVGYTFTKAYCYQWCKGTDVTYQSAEDRPDTAKRWHCRCEYYAEYPMCILKEKMGDVKAYDKCAITGIKNDPAVQETVDGLLPPPSNGDEEQTEPGATGYISPATNGEKGKKHKGHSKDSAHKLMKAFMDKDKEAPTNSAAGTEELDMDSLKTATTVLPINIRSLQCLGWERHLHRCRHPSWGAGGCSHGNDVGICCRGTAQDPCTDYASNKQREGALRITSPHSDFQKGGRLEIFHGGRWGTVCNDGFGAREAKVACKQLGQPYAAAHAWTYGGGGNPQPTEATGHLGAQLRRRKGREDPLGRRKYTQECMPRNPYFMPMKPDEEKSTSVIKAKGGLHCVTALRCCRPEFVFELAKNETMNLMETKDKNSVPAGAVKDAVSGAASAAATPVANEKSSSLISIPALPMAVSATTNGDENGDDENGNSSPNNEDDGSTNGMESGMDAGSGGKDGSSSAHESLEDLSGGESSVRHEEGGGDMPPTLLQVGEAVGEYIVSEDTNGDTPDSNVVPGLAESGITTHKAFWCDCYTLRSIQFLWNKNKSWGICDRRGFYMVGLYKDINAYLFQVEAYRCCRPCIELGNELGLLQTEEATGAAADLDEEMDKEARRRQDAYADPSKWLGEGGVMVTEDIQLTLRTSHRVSERPRAAAPPEPPTNSAEEAQSGAASVSEGKLSPKMEGQSGGQHHWYELYARGSGAHNRKNMAVNLQKDQHISIQELDANTAKKNGFSVVTFNRKDPSKVQDRRHFDTIQSSRAAHDMANYLNSLDENTLVVITTYYGWERHMTQDLGKALIKVGANKDMAGYAGAKKGEYHPYALIGFPNIGSGAGVESLQKNSAKSPFAVVQASLVWNVADGRFDIDDSYRHSTFREKWCDCYEKTQKWTTLDEAPGYDKQVKTCDAPGKEGYLVVGSRRGNYHRLFNLDVWKCCKPCVFIGSGIG